MDNLLDTIKTIEVMAERGAIENKLQSLTVHSMRRFLPQTTVEFLFPLTVLVGKNGSGKTTLMKMIQVLSDCSNPERIFFETVIDNGGMENADFSYRFVDSEVGCKRIATNKWCIEGQVPNTLRIAYLNPKTLIGAFEKSFLYDDVGKKPKQDQKVEYVIRQAKKVLQNKQKESGKKKEWSLNPNTVKMVNDVLQLHLEGIPSIDKGKYACQRVFPALFALFVLAGASPPAPQKPKITRKFMAGRCLAVLPEQKCAQTRKDPQGILPYSQGA